MFISALDYDRENFTQRLSLKIVDHSATEKHVVRPVMSSTRGHVSCYAWEVQSLADSRCDLHTDFVFGAAMAEAAAPTHQSVGR